MKMLSIEVVKELGGGDVWVTGRCCRDDIEVGDTLFHDKQPNVKARVQKIEIYQREESVLAHGYVGGVTVTLLQDAPLPRTGFLVDGFGRESQAEE